MRVGGVAAGTINRNGVGSDLVQNDSTVAAMVTSVLAQLHSLSAYFAGVPANSTAAHPAGPSPVTFHATAGPDNVAVFNIDGAMFSDPNSQQFDLNMGAGFDMMIVNVSGTSVDFEPRKLHRFIRRLRDTSIFGLELRRC